MSYRNTSCFHARAEKWNYRSNVPYGETYRLSRRHSRRITSVAYELLVQYLEDVDVSRLQMTAQLVANLQSVIQKSLVLGRTASVASNARALIELCCLGVDRKHMQIQ
tara:strand:- start:45 stop:368 length:324 start_codon:yes stop_codon:yes gene_type:complete